MNKGKSKIILVVILVILFCLISGYFAYVKIFDYKKIDTTEINETFVTKENTNKIYQDSNVFTENNNNYLAVKKNDKWYEIDHNYSEESTGYTILGVYKDVLYYSDLDGIKYVDLNKDKLKIVKFAMKNDCNNENVYKAFFDKDTLYVEVDDDPYNTNMDDGDKTAYSIIGFSLQDNYFTKSAERLTIISDGPVEYYIDNDKIFYLDDYKDDKYNLKAYDIKKQKTSVVVKNVCNMDIYKNHLIITKVDSTNGERCSRHYFVNTSTLSEVYITNKEVHAVVNSVLYFQDNNKIYEFVEKNGKVKYISDGKINYSGNNLYYLYKNKIYRYEFGKSILIYTAEGAYKIRGFNVDSSSDKDILYVYTEKASFAIVNGEKKDSKELQKESLKYKVNMKDGNVKTFDYSNSLDDIDYDEEIDDEG